MRHVATVRLAAVCALIAVLALFPARAQVAVDIDDLLATMERLGFSVPMAIAGRDPVRRHLGELSREKCDQRAIAELGDALDKAGYRREAAKAHVRYSDICGGHPPSLRSAANILLRLSDYPTAITVASKLIELEAFNDNGYFLRAVAHERSGSPKPAIDDYVTAIELFGNKERISSAGYVGLARSYEKLGQFCDAIASIESWVALSPDRNDTSQARVMIADYGKKGHCDVAVGKEESFSVAQPHGLIRLAVSINGVRGNFILDTGASFVSLRSAFAKQAGVEVDADSSIRLSTANGVTEGKRGRASVIQVRSLQAKNVPVVVQDDGKATYGAGIDGLLGMSFLARFKLTMDRRAVKIAPRSQR
ncbi:MAG: aspartyl protease family protein [Alphaproteobacteria bacterium]|nr:aspartyl protease family protein [Alphaproteobacteria bacterium]